MTVKKILKINISFILIIALLLQVCPVISFAETLSTSVIEFDDASAIIDSQSEPAVYILGEIESKREKNIKYFRQSDGTIYAAVYNDPVHFEQNGTMVEIDNTLVSTQIDSKNYFRNRTNDVMFTVPEVLNENSEVIISKGDKEIRMSLLSSLQSTIQIAEPPVVSASTADELRSFIKTSEKQLMTATANTTATLKSKEDKKEAILEAVKEIEKRELTVENINSTLSYHNVFLNTNIQYDLQGTALKESIVLSAYNGVNSYQYFIAATNLTAELLEDKSVAFYDTETDEAVFYIMAPYMWDAADVYSDDIVVSLSSQNGGYLYSIEPSREWLTSEDRQYPVTIDPTIEKSGGDITKDTVACRTDLGSYYSTLNSGSERNILKVGNKNGYDLHTLIYTPLPSEITSTSRLVSAGIRLRGYTSSSSTCKTVMRINAYMIDTDWDVASVGSTDVVLHGSQVPQYDDRALDYFRCQETAIGFDTDPHVIDITWAAQQWVEGRHANYGVALCDSTPDAQPNNNYARFYDSRHSGDTDPIIYFVIRDTKGIESYWTYTSMTAGRYGTASVNNFNGNAVITQQDYGIGGNRMPVSISHVFNAGNASQTVYGGKWRINYQITISEYGIDDYPYYLTDGDGTEHYFYQVSTNELKDEDGLGYTLTIDSSSSSARYTITDKNNGKMIFNSDGKLVQLKDSSGNTATIAYSSGNISTITDGAGRVYTLAYSNGQLASITAPDSKKITYSYSGGNLSTITYPDGAKTTFTYSDETDKHVMEIIDPDGKKTVIDFKKTAPMRVQLIKRLTDDDAVIDSYSFVYQHNATDIADKDNRKYTYQFNNYGQTTGILNHQGNIAQNYVHGEPGKTGSGEENKLLSSSDVQKTVVNMLSNSDFLYGLDPYYSTWIAEGQVYTCGWSIEKEHRPNPNYSSLKIHRTDMGTATAMHTFVYQDKVAPVDGYYTFSAYVCLDGVQLMDGGALVRLERIDANGTNQGGSQQSITYTGVDKWERLSATYYFNAGDTIRCMMGFNDFTTMCPVWYDDIQLEYGEVANAYTLMSNVDFSSGTTHWNTTNIGTVVDITDADRPQNTTKGIKIEGGHHEERVSQTVVGYGSVGDVYSVGGWAKAESLNTDYARAQGPFLVAPSFCIAVEFYDMNNMIATEKVSFNHAYDGWQFVSKEIIAPVHHTSIKVCLEYVYNVNTAIFTLPYITKEAYGQSYTYDENGNVVSSKEKTEAESNFAYTNDQLSQILNPSGSGYNYTFDSETLLPTYAVSSDGVMEEITYDSAGNPLSATTWSMQPVDEIISGRSYALINAKTGKALDANGTAIRTQVVGKGFEKNNAYQKWTITATSDGLYNLDVTPTTSGTFRLDIPNGADTNGLGIILHNANTSTAQKYRIQANSDGTFTLLTAASSYTKCVDAQPGDEDDLGDDVAVQQYTYVEGDEGQKWYLYEMDITEDNSANIQSSATYTSDKNYISTVTDALGNTTTYNYNTTSGLLNSVTDPRNYTTTYTYDSMNQLKTVNAGGVTATYTYLNDYLTGISVTRGSSYTFVYDDYGRASATKVGNTTLATYTYNDRHLVVRQDYGNGNYVTFSYDDLDRIIEKVYNGNTNRKINYYYDARGRLGLMTDTAGNYRVRYIYDLSGRLVDQQRYSGSNITSDTSSLVSALTTTYQDKTDYVTEIEYESYIHTHNHSFVYGDVAEGTMPDAIYQVKRDNVTEITYTFDDLTRLSTRTINPINKTQTYSYKANPSNPASTSTVVGSMVSDGVTWSYDYDANGNITAIYKNGAVYESYTYDKLNQLASVTTANGDVYTYTYGPAGLFGVTSISGNLHTVSKNGSVINTYSYNDTNWPDKLTAFNGNAITYDSIGNPLQYHDGKVFTWIDGRKLSTVVDGDNTYSYTYDSNGNRIRKTVNGANTQYIMAEGVLLGQNGPGGYLFYFYDESGRPYGFLLNASQAYYYEYNLQGDVIGIFDSTGTKVVTYTYDPWGKLLDISGSAADTVGVLNPIRYRGYYYDTETGFYFLQTRYYDPNIGRFLNADSTDFLTDSLTLLAEKNLFAYCDNNPIIRIDAGGNLWSLISAAVSAINPVTLVIVTVLVVTVVAVVAYNEHRTLKNGSKKRLNDKHTKPRPGRPSEKKKTKGNWNSRK